MAVALRVTGGTSQAGGASAASIVLPKPASIAAGDVVVVFFEMKTTGVTSDAAPDASWTRIRRDGGANAITGITYWHVVTAGDVSTIGTGWTFTSGATTRVTIGACAFTGVDNTTPLAGTTTNAGTTGTTSPATYQAVDGVNNGFWYVADSSTLGSTTFSLPAGFSDLQSEYNSGGTTSTHTVATTQGKALTSTASTGTASSTVASVGAWTTSSVSLNPSGAAPPAAPPALVMAPPVSPPSY